MEDGGLVAAWKQAGGSNSKHLYYLCMHHLCLGI